MQYFSEVMKLLQPGITVLGLHGNMHQLRRMAVFDTFCEKRKAVLFATDVAARGWGKSMYKTLYLSWLYFKEFTDNNFILFE